MFWIENAWVHFFLKPRDGCRVTLPFFFQVAFLRIGGGVFQGNSQSAIIGYDCNVGGLDIYRLDKPWPALATKGFWSSITNIKAHSRRWRIASQTVSSTLARAYRLQFDSTIVHGAYGVVVRCNISSTASRY